MKRSQVVHQISDNVLTSFFPEMSLQLKNLIADAMVAEAEKMGMLPPERVEIDTDNEEYYQEILTNNWESEDKTN